VHTRSLFQGMSIALVLGLALTACAEGEAEDPVEELQEEEGDVGEIEEGETEPGQTPEGESLLDTVQGRGELICGVNDAVAGFGLLTEDGDFEGFDIDFCRVIAAAVIGDADAVQFVPLTAEARFTALQAGEIDVLVRNTTWTASRDGTEGASFATTTFYDGQGMMVRADSDFEEIEDMQNTAVCVLSGTTTELNLASRFAAGGVDYEPVPFEDNDTLLEAFRAERCDGWTSDKSQLAAFRSEWQEGPEDLRILEETFSKEPLGPATRDGDTDWFDAVNWAVIATIQAEEFGITSENIDQFVEDDDVHPDIARFLGLDGFDAGIELPTDFAEQPRLVRRALRSAS
jgi:general L-amino acid transport system substrate-binding protein